MTKAQFSPRLPPGKNITPEVLKANPLLRALIRQRARELRQAKSGK